MNMLMKVAEVDCRGPKSKLEVHLDLIIEFVDNLMIETSLVQGDWWPERLITWAPIT